MPDRATGHGRLPAAPGPRRRPPARTAPGTLVGRIAPRLSACGASNASRRSRRSRTGSGHVDPIATDSRKRSLPFRGCLFGPWLREAARPGDRIVQRVASPARLTAHEEPGAWLRFDCSDGGLDVEVLDPDGDLSGAVPHVNQ